MAEFQKVAEEAKRMCWHYTQKGSHAGCPMYPACNVSQCRKTAFERPAEFEKRVMSWGAEHPEPVYPTWHDFLYEKGVLRDKMVCGMPDMIATDVATDKVNDPIPADIAEKLGIEPKEG